MKPIAELLSELQKNDIRLWADGDRLRFDAPRGAMNSDLRAELGARKAELLVCLKRPDSARKTIRPVARTQPLPLSFAQQRLWFLQQVEGMGSVYHIPSAIRLKGSLDTAALEQSLTAIVRRHESLRTAFDKHDGQPVQVIVPAAHVRLPIEDLSPLPPRETESEVRRLARAEMELPCDLIKGSLWRVRLLRLGGDEFVLLVTMHHIVSDGWSMGIFTRELSALYTSAVGGEARPLPELTIQYADFAHWQREWLQGETLETQREYWRQQLSGAPPLLTLPTDRPRPPVQTFSGAIYRHSVPRPLAAALRALAAEVGATPFMVFLAAFADRPNKRTFSSRAGARSARGVGEHAAGRAPPTAAESRRRGQRIAARASKRQVTSEDTCNLEPRTAQITAGFRSRTGRVKTPCVKGGTHPTFPQIVTLSNGAAFFGVSGTILRRFWGAYCLFSEVLSNGIAAEITGEVSILALFVSRRSQHRQKSVHGTS